MLSIFLLSVCFPRFLLFISDSPTSVLSPSISRKAAEQLTFLSYLKNIELFSESQLFTNYHSHRKIKELLFTPCPATRCAMHRIYADRINSRDMSRVFCDLRSQKTPRGILPVNNNIKEQQKIRGDNFLLELNNYM